MLDGEIRGCPLPNRGTLWFHRVIIPRVQKFKVVDVTIRNEANRHWASGRLLLEHAVEFFIAQLDLMLYQHFL